MRGALAGRVDASVLVDRAVGPGHRGPQSGRAGCQLARRVRSGSPGRRGARPPHRRRQQPGPVPANAVHGRTRRAAAGRGGLRHGVRGVLPAAPLALAPRRRREDAPRARRRAGRARRSARPHPRPRVRRGQGRPRPEDGHRPPPPRRRPAVLRPDRRGQARGRAPQAGHALPRQRPARGRGRHGRRPRGGHRARGPQRHRHGPDPGGRTTRSRPAGQRVPVVPGAPDVRRGWRPSRRRGRRRPRRSVPVAPTGSVSRGPGRGSRRKSRRGCGRDCAAGRWSRTAGTPAGTWRPRRSSRRGR